MPHPTTHVGALQFCLGLLFRVTHRVVITAHHLTSLHGARVSRTVLQDVTTTCDSPIQVTQHMLNVTVLTLPEVVQLYCTVLYCTVLYCTVLYCTVLYCTVLYCTVLYCTVLYCTVLYCTVLYCTVRDAHHTTVLNLNIIQTQPNFFRSGPRFSFV